MQPARTAWHDLQRLRRGAGGGQNRERVRLGVERVDLGGARRPVAAAGEPGEATAHAARGRDLILGPVAAENLPDLEQRHVVEPAIGVLLRRQHETRNEARPHVRQVGRNGICQRKLALAAAKQFGVGLGDERPSHRLDQAARCERALGPAGAPLDRGEHGLARGVAAVERSERDAVDAGDAHDFLNKVRFALNVRSPRRHGHRE